MKKSQTADSPDIVEPDEDCIFWTYRDNMFRDYSNYKLQPETPDMVKEAKWYLKRIMGGKCEIF